MESENSAGAVYVGTKWPDAVSAGYKRAEPPMPGALSPVAEVMGQVGRVNTRDTGWAARGAAEPVATDS